MHQGAPLGGKVLSQCLYYLALFFVDCRLKVGVEGGNIHGYKVGSRAWQPTPVFLPGESQWTERPGALQSMGSQRVRHD